MFKELREFAEKMRPKKQKRSPQTRIITKNGTTKMIPSGELSQWEPYGWRTVEYREKISKKRYGLTY